MMHSLDDSTELTPDQRRREIASILAEGVLRLRCVRQVAPESADSDLRLTAPKTDTSSPAGPTSVGTIDISMDKRLPMPGAIITRRYKGRTVDVRVVPRGFEHEGEVYRTLSAVARQITGAHWNGYHFFGLYTKGQGHARSQMLQYSKLWGSGNRYQISMVRRSWTRTFFTNRRRGSLRWGP